MLSRFKKQHLRFYSVKHAYHVVETNVDPNGSLKTKFVQLFNKISLKLGDNNKPVTKCSLLHANSNLWKSTLILRWPKHVVFESVSKRKLLAERHNIANAMKLLKELNYLDERFDLASDQEKAIKPSQNIDPYLLRQLERMNPPSEICIDDGKLSNDIDSFLSEMQKAEKYLSHKASIFIPTAKLSLIQNMPPNRENEKGLLSLDEEDLDETSYENSDIYSLLNQAGIPTSNTSINQTKIVRDIIWNKRWTPLTKTQSDWINEEAFKMYTNRIKSNRHKNSMEMFRKTLPVYAHRDTILSTIENNAVTVITGDTGSGKSTQVPQYIRENALSNRTAAQTNVCVTQPRRMSCIALTDRVAYEMGERKQTRTSLNMVDALDMEALGLDPTTHASSQTDRNYAFTNVGFQVRLYQSLPKYSRFGLDLLNNTSANTGSWFENVNETNTHKRDFYGSSMGNNIDNKCIAPIFFCTPGILLRKLQTNPDLLGVSHIIVDEVHEHDVLTDFLLAVLKKIVRKNKAATFGQQSILANEDLNSNIAQNSGHIPLHVVLMSATIDAQKFSKYFDDCPVINVQGRLHPVESYFLPDFQPIMQKHISQTLLQAPANKLPTYDIVNEDIEHQRTTTQTANQKNEVSNNVQPKFDVKTVVDTIKYIHRRDCLITNSSQTQTEENHQNGSAGAILVFLPGWQEIKRVRDELETWANAIKIQRIREAKMSGKGQNYGQVSGDGSLGDIVVIPVHSSLPQDEQARVFEDVSTLVQQNSSSEANFSPQALGKSPMTRKIILSTNITETSLTINDVTYVVDTGLAKEHKYDSETGISFLDTVWAAKSNVKQRAGRAGRTRPGQCYHLYPRETFTQVMQPYPEPEILRIPLETIVLETKLLCSNYNESKNIKTPLSLIDPNNNNITDSPDIEASKPTDSTKNNVGEKEPTNIEAFLGSLIIPPTQSGVRSAIDILTHELGFLDLDENLTHLGQRLITMNCHPRLALAFAKATFLGYEDQIANMTASMSHNRSLLYSSNSAHFNNFGGGLDVTTDNSNTNRNNAKLNEEYLLGSLKRIKEKYALAPASDHLAHLNIYSAWRRAKFTGPEYKTLFEEENGIDAKNVTFIDSIRSQLLGEARSAGILSDDVYDRLMAFERTSSNSHTKYRNQTYNLTNEQLNQIDPILSLDANDFKLLKGILGSSFYPNVAKVVYGDIRRGKLYKETIRLLAKRYTNYNIDEQTDNGMGSPDNPLNIDNGSVLIMPSGESLCSDKSNYDTDWITYLNTLKLPHRQNISMCRDISSFHPSALVFLGAGQKIELYGNNKSGQNTSPQLIGSTSIILDKDPLVTFVTRNTDTAARLVGVRKVFNSLFRAYIAMGYANFFNNSSQTDTLQAHDSLNTPNLQDLRDRLKDIFKRILSM